MVVKMLMWKTIMASQNAWILVVAPFQIPVFCSDGLVSIHMGELCFSNLGCSLGQPWIFQAFMEVYKNKRMGTPCFCSVSSFKRPCIEMSLSKVVLIQTHHCIQKLAEHSKAH